MVNYLSRRCQYSVSYVPSRHMRQRRATEGVFDPILVPKLVVVVPAVAVAVRNSSYIVAMYCVE